MLRPYSIYHTVKRLLSHSWLDVVGDIPTGWTTSAYKGLSACFYWSLVEYHFNREGGVHWIGLFFRQGTVSCHHLTKKTNKKTQQSHYVQSGFMLELVHCRRGTTLGDFDRCVRCNWIQLSALWLSVCIAQVWMSPKLSKWLMHGIPLRPVVLPVWGLCCPLRGLSTSSRLRLSTERSDWLRERWRPLPKGGVRQGRRGRRGRVLATRGPSSVAYIWDTTVTWLVTQNSISQTWEFVVLSVLMCCKCTWCAFGICSCWVCMFVKSSTSIYSDDNLVFELFPRHKCAIRNMCKLFYARHYPLWF